MTPDRIYSVLEETAQDMTNIIFFRNPNGIQPIVPDAEGFDYGSGNGYVDGLRAIEAVSN